MFGIECVALMSFFYDVMTRNTADIALINQTAQQAQVVARRCTQGLERGYYSDYEGIQRWIIPPAGHSLQNSASSTQQ